MLEQRRNTALIPRLPEILMQCLELTERKRRKRSKSDTAIVGRKITTQRQHMGERMSTGDLRHHRSDRDTRRRRTTNMRGQEIESERESATQEDMRMIGMRGRRQLRSMSTLGARVLREG